MIQKRLIDYDQSLSVWKNKTALKMLEAVNRKDAQMWRNYSEQLSKGLRYSLEHTDLGHVFNQLLQEQVDLISSLSLESAQRVIDYHDRAKAFYITGGRANEFAEEILKTCDVAASRAKLIARTEISRTSAILTQARAESIGSTGYIWRTSADRDVRDSHKKMEGVFVPWNKPPVFTDGKQSNSYHAGCFPNCRCWQEVIIPED